MPGNARGSLLRHASRLVELTTDLAAIAGVIALVVVMIVVVADVIGRYLGSPLFGAQDIVQMAAVIVVFGGMAHCDRGGGHVSVDLLEPYFPPALNRCFTLAGHLAGAVVFALIAWQLIEASALSRMLNMATNILQLPRAPFQYAVAAFCALTSAAMILRVVALLGRFSPESSRSPTGKPR